MSITLISLILAGNSQLEKPDLCASATWRTARLYNSPVSLYSEAAPYPPSYQNELAQKKYDEIMAMGEVTDSDSCTTAVQWLTCASAFPYCPVSSLSMSAISYLLPCKWHCDYLNKLCNLDLDCANYLDFTTCTIYVPDGYFYIPPEKGSLATIPKLYLALVLIYAIFLMIFLTMYLFYAKIRRKPQPVPVGAMILLLAARGTSCYVLYYFWNQCSYHDGMCQFDRAYVTLAIVQFLEAIVYLVLSFQAKFLATYTNTSRQLEFRGTYMCCAYFYIMVVVSRRWCLRAPNDFYIFFMVSGYAVLFYNMVYKHREDNVFMYSQLAYINDRTNAQTVDQMKHKTRVSYVYFYIALLLLAIEITCQTMFVNINMHTYTLIAFYEISILVIMT
eukprot:gene37140-45082_t